MGDRGPVPKRTDQVRRRNVPETPVDTAPASLDVDVPEADENWHAIARQWYISLAASGQSIFYEPSDWATAYLIAESISRDLNPQFVAVTEQGEVVKEKIPMKGASLAAYLRAMSVLLATEGDRRRSRLELQRASETDVDEAAAVTALDDYRARLESAG